MTGKYRRHQASRRAGHLGRARRLQREHRLPIEPPVAPVAQCAGCLADIRAGAPIFRNGAQTYCSSSCLVKGRHWVDPSRCGGCHGEHPMGVRP